MNKQEFFSYLKNRFQILDKNETEDILAEFDQHINNKIKNGYTEEEAIADFGNPEELVEEILEAYKVNPEYTTDNNPQSVIGRFLKNFGNSVNTIADSFFHKSKKELFFILVKFAFLCFILWLIHIPLAMIINQITNAFAVLPPVLEQPLSSTLNILFNIAYLLVVCYTIYLFVVRTFPYADYEANNKIKPKRKEESIVEDYNRDSEKNNNNEITNEIIVEENKQKSSDNNIISEIKEKGYNFKKQSVPQSNEHALLKIIVVCLKIAVIIFVLPVFIYGLFNIIGFFASLILMFTGLPLIGTTLAALGSLICTWVFLIAVLRLVFQTDKGKEKNQNIN